MIPSRPGAVVTSGGTASPASTASAACSATTSATGRSSPAAATRAASPRGARMPTLAPTRATSGASPARLRPGSESASSPSPAAAAAPAPPASSVDAVTAAHPRHRGRAAPRELLGAPSPEDAHRQPADAHERDDLEGQGEAAEDGGERVAGEAHDEPGAGELGQERGADREDEHDPRREASLGDRRDRIAVLAGGGLERAGQVTQERREVAPRVALEQDAGDDRVPGRRGGAAAERLQHAGGRRAQAQRPRRGT